MFGSRILACGKGNLLHSCVWKPKKLRGKGKCFWIEGKFWWNLVPSITSVDSFSLPDFTTFLTKLSLLYLLFANFAHNSLKCCQSSPSLSTQQHQKETQLLFLKQSNEIVSHSLSHNSFQVSSYSSSIICWFHVLMPILILSNCSFVGLNLWKREATLYDTKIHSSSSIPSSPPLRFLPLWLCSVTRLGFHIFVLILGVLVTNLIWVF